MKQDQLVQYIVGLCCLRRNPDAVEIVLGDMVNDPCAGKSRDVDVTVRVHEEDGTFTGLYAFEAKDEGSPLDVIVVEQLCAKLTDMPEIARRAIVSTSGYSEAARNKAASKGVELFTLEEWTSPIQTEFTPNSFPGTPQQSIRLSSVLLTWVPGRTFRFSVEPFSSGSPDNTITVGRKLVTQTGTSHRSHPTVNALWDEAMGRSTQRLWSSPEAQDELARCHADSTETVGLIGRQWAFSDAVGVRDLDVFLDESGQLLRVTEVTISGYLQWEHSQLVPEFKIMRNRETGELYAAAAVALVPSFPPEVLGMLFAPGSQDVAIHRVSLTKKQIQRFRELVLYSPHR